MECYPDKAQYQPGDTVTIQVKAPAGTSRLELTISSLYRDVVCFSGAPDEPIRWNPPPCEWAAYGVDCRALDAAGAVLVSGHTAFDVADRWYRAPRFGFITDFAAGETLSETRRRIDLMVQLHINCLHFYDWFYTHHQYLPPEENFVDSLGRELSVIVVRRKIRLSQRAGMTALAYGPVYGAEESVVRAHPDWAFYRSDGVPFNVARLFYIMDFRPESPWTEHILSQYAQAVTDLGFDGIQIDQYGYPQRVLAHPGSLGQPSIDLSDLFLPFVERAAATVRGAKPGAEVVFHAINNWPLRKVATGPQVANYIVVTSPHETYRDLRDLIDGARTLAPEKPVILAAYLRAFANSAEPRAEAALRLLLAVIHAAGGYNVILGEGDGVLTGGYFPDYARLGPEILGRIRPYFDFVVRYGPVLHVPAAYDVSETHTGGVTEVYGFGGAPWSPMPVPGTIWTVIREHPEFISINLVNLTGSVTGRWADDQDPPQPISNFTVTCRVLEPITAVYLADPDRQGGQMLSLPFSVEPDPHTGHLLRFTVTNLLYWGLALIVPAKRTAD